MENILGIIVNLYDILSFYLFHILIFKTKGMDNYQSCQYYTGDHFSLAKETKYFDTS
jgi:hypothetical protein